MECCSRAGSLWIISQVRGTFCDDGRPIVVQKVLMLLLNVFELLHGKLHILLWW